MLANQVLESVTHNDLICSILDCKNNNCYFALYEKSNNELVNLIEPQAESLDSAISIIKSYCEDNFNNYSITFVGDGSISFKEILADSFATSNFADSNLNILNSYNLGLLGFKKYNDNNLSLELLPLYLKKPLAQRQLEERTGNKNG